MSNRRSFFKKIIAGTTFCSIQGFSNQIFAEELAENMKALTQMNTMEAVQNEGLWNSVRQAYSVSKSYINLNNGGVSPQPTLVQNAQKKYLELINEMPSLYGSRVLPKSRFALRRKLAQLGGCLPEEIALMQNTTEGIGTVMSGIDWKAGDEVVVSKQDYSTVQLGWEQLERRFKIKLVWVNLPSPIEDDEAIVKAYTSKFTSRTRFVHLTHMINWTGQLIPSSVLATICTKARKQGIFSLIDGAHSFAHIDFKIKNLNCDAFATSLHKWLCAPLGMGMLYVRQDQISQLWSLFPSSVDQTSKIEKFEHKGTISMAKEEATYTAIEFHESIGIELKEARLRYLKNYWVEQLKENPLIKFYTSFDKRYSGGIALFDIEGKDYYKMAYKLELNYKIHNTQSKVDGAQGIRISPNIYTSLDDLDRFLEAMTALIK